MGFGGVSIWQLLIILLIIVMLFGTKRLRGMGSDLGAAIKGFRSSFKESDNAAEQDAQFTTPSAVTNQAPAQNTAQSAATSNQTASALAASQPTSSQPTASAPSSQDKV